MTATTDVEAQALNLLQGSESNAFAGDNPSAVNKLKDVITNTPNVELSVQNTLLEAVSAEKAELANDAITVSGDSDDPTKQELNKLGAAADGSSLRVKKLVHEAATDQKAVGAVGSILDGYDDSSKQFAKAYAAAEALKETANYETVEAYIDTQAASTVTNNLSDASISYQTATKELESLHDPKLRALEVEDMTADIAGDIADGTSLMSTKSIREFLRSIKNTKLGRLTKKAMGANGDDFSYAAEGAGYQVSDIVNNVDGKKSDVENDVEERYDDLTDALSNLDTKLDDIITEDEDTADDSVTALIARHNKLNGSLPRPHELAPIANPEATLHITQLKGADKIPNIDDALDNDKVVDAKTPDLDQFAQVTMQNGELQLSFTDGGSLNVIAKERLQAAV